MDNKHKGGASTAAGRVNVLGVGVSVTNMQECVESLLQARREDVRGYVCVTGVHGVMESLRDQTLRQIHNRSLMTVPDGVPTVWRGRLCGHRNMGRVYGPDLMLAICARSVEAVDGLHDNTRRDDFTHFLYGSTEETLQKMKSQLGKRFPGLRIVGAMAPPFRALTAAEEADLERMVAAVKPDFFWVGLSTPKQERFMASHASTTSDHSQGLACGIMFGVGAAFDIHAGNYIDSPNWVKRSGLQWLHRLCTEPRRLWRRYGWIVPGFLWYSLLQATGMRKFPMEDCSAAGEQGMPGS